MVAFIPGAAAGIMIGILAMRDRWKCTTGAQALPSQPRPWPVKNPCTAQVISLVREGHGVVPRSLGAGRGRPYARAKGAWPGVPLRFDGEAVG